MANINHSSNIRLQHHHHNHHAITTDNKWPEQHDLIVTTRSGVALRAATSQMPLRRLHNVQSTALAAFVESATILIAHDGRILAHDAGSCKSTTFRLKGSDAEVKYIVAVPRTQDFLFWTKRSNVIRGISCATRNLTTFSCVHPGEPTCLAISHDGRFLISCSRRPATVYLQDMERPKSQIPIRLRVTRSHVVVTTFHPERAAIFLLAHNDGSVAIHDARRILKLRETGIKTDGLIRHVTALHHRAIVAAAFVPGYRMRVITLGSHGKCRITEFEDTIAMIVTWDIGLQCTTLAVFSPTSIPSSTTQDKSSDETIRVKSGVTSISKSDSVIAVGCCDGTSKIYSSIGLLQSDMPGMNSSVVGLHWIRREVVDNIKLKSLKMEIVDIDWPPAHSPPSSQESSKSLSLRKENQRLAQEIAKIELPLGVKPVHEPRLDPAGLTTCSPVKQAAAKVTKRRSPPRTPRRSPPRTSSPLKMRVSQPNLLATLKRRRRPTTPSSATPPRKNLHEEPPGSSPREAQYIPGSWISTPSKDYASSPVRAIVPRHLGHREPTPFEAHLMGGSLLAGEQLRNMRHDRLVRYNVERTGASQPVEETRPSAFGAHFMNGTLLAVEQAKSLEHSHPSPARPVPPTASPSIHRQQVLHVTMRRPEQGSHRDNYSSEDNESVENEKDDVQPHQKIHSSAHHHHHPSEHNHTWPPPLSPMPGHYPSSRSASSEDEDTLYEDAQEYESRHIREPWCHRDGISSGEHEPADNFCDCNCADVVREEMALVRGEIASLRKTVWVLAAGLGVDGGEMDRRLSRVRGESNLWRRAE